MSAALKADQAALTPLELIQAVIDDGRKQICQNEGFMAEEELKSAAAIETNAKLYFDNPATLILWPSELGQRNEQTSLLLSKPFNSSRQKVTILNEIRVSLSRLIKSTSLVSELLTVADEFITNAIYNAPFVDPVTHQQVKVDRINPIDLPQNKNARIFLAEDGQRLLIGVEDPFGSLNVGAYLERMRQCYMKGLKEAMSFGPGGAGIGSFLIFNTGSSLYVGVKPGALTIVGCVVPYRLSGRRREELPKHLHWIEIK